MAGVVGRADLLCTLFYFLGFIAYCNSLHFDWGIYQAAMLLLSMVFCATAMFCKEQGITVIVSKWTLAFTKLNCHQTMKEIQWYISPFIPWTMWKRIYNIMRVLENHKSSLNSFLFSYLHGQFLIFFQGLCSVYDVIVNGKQHPLRILRRLQQCFILRKISWSPGHSEQCPMVTPSNCDTPGVQNRSWVESNKQRHVC